MTSSSKNKKVFSYLQNLPKQAKVLICGLFSGFCSRVVVLPVERVTILQQTNKTKEYIKEGKNPTMRRLMSSIYKKEGISGIFTGAGIQLMRVVPLTAFEFFYYDISQSYIVEKSVPSASKHIKNLISGCLAGMMAYSTVYPIDFVRVQKATGNVPEEWSFIKSFRHVRKKNGFFQMYQGLGATQISVIPFTGIKFLVFEFTQELIFNNKDSDELSSHENLIAGSVAGMVATAVTYPIEILRRRKQVNTQDKKKKNMGYKDIAKEIQKKQGFKGFFQGLKTMMYKTVPSIALAFYFNEWSKKKLQIAKL